jgi:hypothetical protein
MVFSIHHKKWPSVSRPKALFAVLSPQHGLWFKLRVVLMRRQQHDRESELSGVRYPAFVSAFFRVAKKMVSRREELFRRFRQIVTVRNSCAPERVKGRPWKT